MNDPERTDIRADLEPGIEPAEAAVLVELGERLRAARPVPRAEFRGDLRRGLLTAQGTSPAPRPAPARLRELIAASGLSGATLLFVAALSVVGVGPLAA